MLFFFKKSPEQLILIYKVHIKHGSRDTIYSDLDGGKFFIEVVKGYQDSFFPLILERNTNKVHVRDLL